MKNRFAVAFLCGAILCFCSAEFTADMVYEILSSKLDILFFTMKSLRNEVDDINENVEVREVVEQTKEQCLEVKALFQSLKVEMNERLDGIEAKLTRKMDDIVQEAIVSINKSVIDKVSDIDRKCSKKNDQLNRNKYRMRKFMTSEKIALRKLNNQSVNDTRKNIRNITDMLEGRLQNMEQINFLLTNRSEIRIKELENKMFVFENGHSVYFHVSVKEDKKISENSRVKYDFVITNKGNGYNSSSGIFTAPYSGVYMFLYFAGPSKGQLHYVHLHLYVDGIYNTFFMLPDSYTDDRDIIEGHARVAYMYAGKQAWIQTRQECTISVDMEQHSQESS